MKNKLVNLIGPLVSFSSGVVYATIDVFTSGNPILSGGLGAHEFAQIWSVPKEDSMIKKFEVKKVVKNCGSYILGSAITFGVSYYRDEIYNFVEGVLK